MITTETNHANLPANEIYDRYVGMITPEEFVAGCESIEQAVEWHLESYFPCWGEEPPVWLGGVLVKYLHQKLD